MGDSTIMGGMGNRGGGMGGGLLGGGPPQMVGGGGGGQYGGQGMDSYGMGVSGGGLLGEMNRMQQGGVVLLVSNLPDEVRSACKICAQMSS
jgi:hypothetical protein